MDNRYYFELNNDKLNFPTSELQHLLKVRRAKIGDTITAFNGDGFDYHFKIKDIQKNDISVELIDKIKNKAVDDKKITVFLAMIKNEALSTLIDNLAELNVKSVCFFRADRSVAIIDNAKLDKLKTRAIQASKQCERADIMNISIIDKKDICKAKNIYFAYEDSTNKITKVDGDFSVIIGPEGGFSEDENNYFSSFAKNISLGKTILRAEVAGVVAVSMLKAVNCDR